MTEDEAIELHISENLHRISVIEEFLRTNTNRDDEECRKNIQVLTKINGVLQEIQKYRAIGTVEECQEVMEKQKTKKYKTINMVRHCSGCDCQIKAWYTFCPLCGQAIDWSGTG